ncbi:hypothetical protein ABZ926_22705 [Streptomyces litmocidini]|uniref:hypothetical protein n=1 Tax=Streptomyces TaxID=1883 RepID=UPI000F48C903|nr:hypothetical protein [Streptomyces sp. PanSC19]ROQ33776.1 hypothetical protein EDD98_2808 [Streptomyces sp. PanSC19]
MPDQPSNADLSSQIIELKTQVSIADEFQITLAGHYQSILTSRLDYLKGKIEDIHKEIVKNPVTEYWEAAGFDGIAAGIEKLYEGEGLGTALKYWLSNGAGAFAAILIGGIGVYLTGKLVSIRRDIQELLSRHLPGATPGLIRGYDENGNVTPQTREQIEARERRVANGGTSLADLPQNANFDGLRTQLGLLIPQMEAFNEKAPAFLRDFRKLPKESAAQKAARGVKAVADAVKEVDHQSMPLVASGMGKITGAVRNSDPKKTKKFADAIGKLKLAVKDLDVDKVPKMATFQNAANAAKDLADHTGTLSGRMRAFAEAVRDLNNEMSGGAPA